MARIYQFILWLLVSETLAVVLPTSDTSHHSSTSTAVNAITTAPPVRKEKLRKRQQYGPDVCGYNDFESLTCYDAAETCAGTQMPNGQLYEYCATNGAFIHEVWTTAYPYGKTPASCSPNECCCPEEMPDVSVNLFVTSGSTWTNWQCWIAVAINTWTAAHALRAPSEVASNPTAMPTSSSFSESSNTDSDSGHKHTASSSSAPTTSSGDQGGMTESNEIALGVGIPSSIAGIIGCCIAWKAYKRKYKAPKAAKAQYQEYQMYGSRVNLM